MVLSSTQLRWGRILVIPLGMLVLLCQFWPLKSSQLSITRSQRDWALDGIHSIENQTLGFGKVFAINLPNRPDKRDNIVLGSSVCNFQVEFVDGVVPDVVPPKAYPYNWNPDHSASEYAARRAHLDGIRRIVEQGLGSGLIVEDDADWDLNIKTQLQSFALAVRGLQGTRNTKTSSPYGDDWDILWLGHCGLECKTNLPYYESEDDLTVLEPRHFLPYWRDPPAIERSDHSRMVCTAQDAVCTSFYAVSYHGAQKLLAALSVNPSGLAEEIEIGSQIDVAVGRMCGHGYLRCFAPYPAITGVFRSAGAAEKGSDIHQEGAGDTVGFASWGMLYSTMLNVQRILRGQPVKATWGDVEKPIMVPENILVREGKLYKKTENGPQTIESVAVDEQYRRTVHLY
ncbi:uncharacterized protein N7484_002635 [Penicillium longicatenatum]|uniref:uncharacterized protein n=1 Tax=Penicillium longicatenatum TaxID=1561947 RepID=UPI002549ADED|nr:uncharacterized protein N7484_002635 [Penicillium longicatenatum]KAJ5648912.1 hypothetical protein N7484_002635 [Penicillium longicatenatum]